MLADLQALARQGRLPAEMDEAELTAVAAVLEEVRAGASEILIRKNEPGNRLYVILEGRVQADVGSDTSSHAEERVAGDLVGEVEFLAEGAHLRDVRCLEETRLGLLGRAQWNELLQQNPAAWKKLCAVAVRAMRRSQLTGHLDRLFGPFGKLLPFIMKDIEEKVEWMTLKSGEVLIRQGDPADNVYLLMTGRLLVAVENDEGQERIVNTVMAGETVGELAALAEGPRSSSVHAARDSELVRLSRGTFEMMLERSSRALLTVSRILVSRLVHTAYEHDPSRHPISCIGLVPAGPDVSLEEVALALENSLSEHGSVMRLSSERVERELGVPGIAQVSDSDPVNLRLVQWLQECEAKSRYLVYVADRTWSPWSERCARQSDRVTVVADADAPPELGPVEHGLAGLRKGWGLLLLHPQDRARPEGTRRWLDGSSVESVLHVRRGHAGDLARLVRILSGRAVGLVFGGGGARGFAHLGVLQALEEVGIPVDMVGGTSIGAPVAGFTAQGYDAATALQIVEEGFRSLLDYTLPITSLLAGRRISQTIHQHGATWDIEDLWLPYYCVSTNLTTARMVVHRRGNLAHAVRASVSIPGVLPPLPSGRDLLVDGGVLNNLPIDAMREMNPFGPVIAVDVVGPKGPTSKDDYGMSLSGWRLLSNKLNPWSRNIPAPNIAGIILRSMLVGASVARERMLEDRLADLYLNIHVRGISMLQFDAARKVASLGFEESLGRLKSWKQTGGLSRLRTADAGAPPPGVSIEEIW